jgi:hypothetical protein
MTTHPRKISLDVRFASYSDRNADIAGGPQTRRSGNYAANSLLEVCIASLVQLFVGVAHCFRLCPAEHNLKINWLEAVVDVTMNDTGRAGNAIPRPQRALYASPFLVLHEYGEPPAQHKKTLFYFVCMRSISLPRLDVHDAEREAARWDDRRIVMLARPAGTDESMLRAFVSLDLCVFERRPIALFIDEPSNVAVRNLRQGQGSNFGRHGMAGGSHRALSLLRVGRRSYPIDLFIKH